MDVLTAQDFRRAGLQFARDDAVHVVVSYKSSGGRRITFYRWDEVSRDFTEGVADEGVPSPQINKS